VSNLTLDKQFPRPFPSQQHCLHRIDNDINNTLDILGCRLWVGTWRVSTNRLNYGRRNQLLFKNSDITKFEIVMSLFRISDHYFEVISLILNLRRFRLPYAMTAKVSLF